MRLWLQFILLLLAMSAFAYAPSPETFSRVDLHLITNRTVPAAVDIIGDANSNSTVTVNFQPVVRQGDYFWKELSVSNATAAVYQSVTNIGVLRNGTNADIITTNIGSLLVAKTPETFTHDLDGNLTSDGLWTNTWNANNELIAMESRSGVPSAARLRLTFAYDHRGRRTQKIVSTWNGSAYVGQSTNKFLYDGWNLVAELNHTNGLIRSYVWGLDLSGSVHGAGGVGGLLAVNTPTNGANFACFDGNGNVAGLVSAATGASSATFEHDPFGNSLGAFGPMANELPLLFSTKYFDVETGSYYYGYRYMKDGRWMICDPIGEAGGENLFGFVRNNPIRFVDPFGLATGDWWDVRSWWAEGYWGGFREGWTDGAGISWQSIQAPFAGVGQIGGNLSTAGGRAEYEAMLRRLGPLLAKLYADECFRQEARKKLGSEFGEWLDGLGTAEGQSRLLSGAGVELFLTAGTLGLSQIKWLDELESLARRLDRVSPDGVSTSVLDAARTAPTRWSPLNGPGPVGADVAATFRGGSYSELVTSEATTLYRAYGGEAGQLGRYWSRTPPAGPLQSRIDSALNPAWGEHGE